MNTTLQPSTFAGFKALRTGSDAIDRLFGDVGTLAPHLPNVLHMFGGSETLQRRFLLALCYAAVSRGERSVFIDMGGDLDSHGTREAGLGGSLDSSNPAAPDAHFRVIGPRELSGAQDSGEQNQRSAGIFPALRGTLRGLSKFATPPAVVVVNGVQCALFDHLRAQPAKLTEELRSWETLDGRAQGAIMLELLNAHQFARRGHFALWFAHSPRVKHPRSDAPNALTGPFATALRGAMKKECRGGLELGDESLGGDGDGLIIAAKARDSRGSVAKEGAFELWLNGGVGFRNG